MHNWTSSRTKKGVFTTPESISWCLGSLSCYGMSSTVLSQATQEKKFSKFDNHPSWQSHKKRKWSPVQRPVVQQVDRRQGETWKCQLLDFAWTNYQVEFCKFRLRSTVPVSYLERYSPKGSCHPAESDMSHTLAQTCLIKFWCGMHLSCKKTSIYTWQEGLVWSEKKITSSTHWRIE